jgi:hypothetical protein
MLSEGMNHPGVLLRGEFDIDRGGSQMTTQAETLVMQLQTQTPAAPEAGRGRKALPWSLQTP